MCVFCLLSLQQLKRSCVLRTLSYHTCASAYRYWACYIVECVVLSLFYTSLARSALSLAFLSVSLSRLSRSCVPVSHFLIPVSLACVLTALCACLFSRVSLYSHTMLSHYRILDILISISSLSSRSSIVVVFMPSLSRKCVPNIWPWALRYTYFLINSTNFLLLCGPLRSPLLFLYTSSYRHIYTDIHSCVYTRLPYLRISRWLLQL